MVPIKFIKNICLLLTLISMTYSCETFESVDVRIKNYVTQIEQNSKEMTEKEWEEADAQMELFKKELEQIKMDLTVKQVESANQTIGKYAGLRLKNGIKDFGEQLKDLGNQLEGVITELSDTSNNQ